MPRRPSPDTNFMILRHTDPAFAIHIGKAFPFFRRHADGRYTDRTMMNIATYHDTFLGYRSDREHLDANMPLLIVAETPFHYDEVNEVKTGGVVGMALVDPRTRRMMIAVHKDARRQGIGRILYHEGRRNFGRVVLWAGRRNTPGQHFCLAMGLVATALNSAGAIRYSMEEDDDD